jgi:hypothetical protein
LESTVHKAWIVRRSGDRINIPDGAVISAQTSKLHGKVVENFHIDIGFEEPARRGEGSMQASDLKKVAVACVSN